ncbi:MAG: exosome complex exonuclease Rrp41, partial [Metallosphaera sp.]
DMWGEADMPVAMMPSLGQITLIQLNGHMTPEEFKQGLDLAYKGINTIYSMEKEVLKSKFAEMREEGS